MKCALISLVAISFLASAACVEQSNVGELENALVDGTPDAVGLLGFLNDPTTTFTTLDDEVPLDRRAATNLMAARPFATVAAVDEVKYVGDKTLARLIAFARERGFVPAGSDLLGSYDGVSFTVDQADAALRIVNDESDGVLHGEVGLDSRAVTSIIAARPVLSMPELAELYWVGSRGLENLRDYVDSFIPATGARADCRSHSDCTEEERCGGRPSDGSTEFGKCYPTRNYEGYWEECDESNPCQAELFCSGLTWGGNGWCSPEWMQDTVANDTHRSIPADGTLVTTSVVLYGLASVPRMAGVL